jgi:tight adherence protein B
VALVLTVFFGILLLIFVPYWGLVLRQEQQEERVVRKRLRVHRVGNFGAGLLKSRENLSSIPALDGALSRFEALANPARDLVARSGLQRMTLGRLVMASVFLGLLTTASVTSIAHSVLAGLVAGIFAAALPLLYVKRVARKRQDKFEEQFPEATDLIARALRAGHALPTALQMVAEEMADPVGAEFRLLFEQQNYGLSLPEALRAFGDRVRLLDARFFVTAVLTQREAGGNLSEVLDRLSAVIRERFKVKRQVRVVSAHGRITGIILGCLPPAVAGILFLTSPDHIRLLVNDILGVYMITFALFLQCVGVLIIRRIVNVEY